jgi:hypothetical protein
MRTVFVIGMAMTLLMVGLAGALAVAGDEAKSAVQQELEKKSGKELYKLTCKPCHLPESPAGEYTPMTLIQEQWETFFDTKYEDVHQALVDSVATRPDWVAPEQLELIEQVGPKMLEKIRRFAVDGAADSEHPMTCG